MACINMILHNNPTALFVLGNMLVGPKFKNHEVPMAFDYVVAIRRSVTAPAAGTTPS